jgi:hypothetical protein
VASTRSCVGGTITSQLPTEAIKLRPGCCGLSSKKGEPLLTLLRFDLADQISVFKTVLALSFLPTEKKLNPEPVAEGPDVPKPFWQLLGQGQGNQTALPSSTPSRARLPLIAHHVPVRNISDTTSQEKARSSSSRTASPRISLTFPHQRELNFTKEPSKKFR